jgi:hypothetical protein
MAERTTYQQRVTEIEDRRLSKIEAKLLKRTPEGAEWVILRVVSDREMRAFMARGWEIVDYPSKGAYKDWVNVYTMRRSRAALVAALANPASARHDVAVTGQFLINEVPVSEYGFTLTARTSSSTTPDDRHGTHSLYTIELLPDVSVLTDGPLSWSFSGEIERAVVIAALRELARQLETRPGPLNDS